MQTRFNAKHCLLAAALLLISFASNAQCAMCRAAIESEGNSEKAEAINDGIVYLMVIPYVLVGAIGYAIYRMRKNKKA
jgi:amino acid permease